MNTQVAKYTGSRDFCTILFILSYKNLPSIWEGKVIILSVGDLLAPFSTDCKKCTLQKSNLREKPKGEAFVAD